MNDLDLFNMTELAELLILLNKQDPLHIDIPYVIDELKKRAPKLLEVDEETFTIRRSLRTANEEWDRYADWILENPDTCIYCGQPATEEDHLLPLPWTGKAVRSQVPTVPACRSCNASLNDFPNPIIYERCQIIADAIEYERYEILRIGGPSAFRERSSS